MTALLAEAPVGRQVGHVEVIAGLPAADQLSSDHVVAGLPAISLADLGERGALLTRVDRKYVVPRTQLTRFLTELSEQARATGQRIPRVLAIAARREFGYESLYFDTPGLTSYLQAARRRPRRFKVRTRTYVDSGQAFLEVKTRDGRRRTVKTRMDVPDTTRWGRELDPLAQSFVAGHLDRTVAHPDEVSWHLRPTLWTRYRRTTLFLPDDGARVTIDLELRAWNTTGATLVVPAVAVVETKTEGRACMADRALWRLGIRPVRLSKYGTGLAALNPDLPAHKWQPALRRLAVEIH